MIDNSRQKFKYIENKKSFKDEINSVFHHFQKDFIEANTKIFLEGESLTLKEASRGIF